MTKIFSPEKCWLEFSGNKGFYRYQNGDLLKGRKYFENIEYDAENRKFIGNIFWREGSMQHESNTFKYRIEITFSPTFDRPVRYRAGTHGPVRPVVPNWITQIGSKNQPVIRTINSGPCIPGIERLNMTETKFRLGMKMSLLNNFCFTIDFNKNKATFLSPRPCP